MDKKIRVLVMDNQIVDPPEAGGPLRIFNIFGSLPDNFLVHYMGVTGWQHIKSVKKLNENFSEEIMPLNKPFLRLNNLFTNLLGSIPAFDAMCAKMMFMNPRFIKKMKRYIKKSDILVSSHPWFFPHIVNYRKKIRVYDSHNCEYILYKKFLKKNFLSRILSQIKRNIEKQACNQCDLLLACTEDDKRTFMKLFGTKNGKIPIIPNPINISFFSQRKTSDIRKAKKKLGLAEKKTLCFIGTYYRPNIEAFRFIMKELVPNMPDYTFLIMGRINEDFEEQVDDDLKHISMDKVKINNKGVLGYGWHMLEKWGAKGFDVRWTRRNFSIIIKDKNVQQLLINARSIKPIRASVYMNNQKIKEMIFFAPKFKEVIIELGGRGIIKEANIEIRLAKTNKPVMSDTREVGIAVRNICYVSDFKENRISLLQTVSPLMVPPNVVLYGPISNEKLKQIYRASDIAINPVFSGSGFNIKMLDYMAMGIPIVTTAKGARGLDIEHDQETVISEPRNFKDAIEKLFKNKKKQRELVRNGRRFAEGYDKQVIGAKLGKIFEKRLKKI